jgi:hypothetical protein
MIGRLLEFAVLMGAFCTLSGCSVDNRIVKIAGNDAFFQADPAEVDVLIVIDDSGSMELYQQQLSTRFDTFLSYFPDSIDYRVGVTTSTMVPAEPFGDCTQADITAAPQGGRLALETWIDNEDSGGAETFEELVQVGICGGTYEMGLESALLAVTGENPGFRRPDASLSLVLVSDEEDNSPGTTSDYLQAFRDHVSASGRMAFNASALVIVDESACDESQLAGGAHQNLRFTDLAQQTGGAVGDLCNEDFDDIVTQVSQASSRMSDTFYLTARPSPASLEVGVSEELVPCDAGVWTYQLLDGHPVIVFDPANLPPPGSRITVSYDHGSGEGEATCVE